MGYKPVLDITRQDAIALILQKIANATDKQLEGAIEATLREIGKGDYQCEIVEDYESEGRKGSTHYKYPDEKCIFD